MNILINRIKKKNKKLNLKNAQEICYIEAMIQILCITHGHNIKTKRMRKDLNSVNYLRCKLCFLYKTIKNL